MNIRKSLEERERQNLSPYAALSRHSRGRGRPEKPCDIRTCYQRDRDRILHCKAFRRLKHKTQVFLSPEGDHYRTRLTHTLEVAQIARTIARALLLNEDLTEAIALGHDLGHTPFGHAGEYALEQALSGTPYHFQHYMQSIRVIELLEKNGNGLNLTWEVKDGIQNHGMKHMPHTLEGKIVRLCDKIAYINHDVDDAIRGGVLSEEELPGQYTAVLGYSVRERLNYLIHDIVVNSAGKPDIIQSPAAAEAMAGLRAFMFREVYRGETVKTEDGKVAGMIGALYRCYMEHWQILTPKYIQMMQEGEPKELVVCDYIAGMTDTFAIARFEEFFVPKAWSRL